MLTRAEALRRIGLGVKQWMEVDVTDAHFVHDEFLKHDGQTVTTAATDVVPLSQVEDWEDLLDPARSWLNATLHVDAAGRPVISLLAGPKRAAAEVDPNAEVPIAVSREPKTLRLVE